jgi:hypothetical protein
MQGGGLIKLSFTAASLLLISLLTGVASADLLNLSSRGFVGSGDDVMIAGFVIDGTTPLPILIRGRGPSLSGAPFSVARTLANPVLQIFSGQSLIAANDDWQQIQQQEILATGLDPCRPNPGQSSAPPGCSLESAILVTLPPGAYTAVLRGAGGGTGVGLVEVYELTGSVITLPNIIGVYSGSISLTQARCQSPSNNGTIGSAAKVNINSQTASLFSGTGSFSAGIDSVTFNIFGTITGTGALTGTFTSIAAPSGLRSAGTFTGSRSGNALMIHFSGQITAGETCTVEGDLSVSR